MGHQGANSPNTFDEEEGMVLSGLVLDERRRAAGLAFANAGTPALAEA
jgi:hypothetical protein